jgi:hypothetical protein
MDRRSFIKTGLLVPVAVAASLGAACAPPAPRRSVSDTRGAPAVAPTAVPVIVPAALQPAGPLTVRSMGGQHSLDFLADLVGLTSSQVASPQIEEWLATRAEAERAAIQALNKGMAEKGFSDTRDPRVFVNGDVVFYGIGNVDGRNACAPFWVNGQREALVEGPAIVGLSLMARDWTASAGVPASQALIPVGTIHRDQGAQFGVGFPYPYVYKTAIGRVALNYQPAPSARHPMLVVVTERDDGSLILRGDYELREG